MNIEIEELMALRVLLGQTPRTDSGVRNQIRAIKAGNITPEQAGFEVVSVRRNKEEYRLVDESVGKFWVKLTDWVEKNAPK